MTPMTADDPTGLITPREEQKELGHGRVGEAWRIRHVCTAVLDNKVTDEIKKDCRSLMNAFSEKRGKKMEAERMDAIIARMKTEEAVKARTRAFERVTILEKQLNDQIQSYKNLYDAVRKAERARMMEADAAAAHSGDA